MHAGWQEFLQNPFSVLKHCCFTTSILSVTLNFIKLLPVAVFWPRSPFPWVCQLLYEIEGDASFQYPSSCQNTPLFFWDCSVVELLYTSIFVLNFLVLFERDCYSPVLQLNSCQHSVDWIMPIFKFKTSLL